MNFNFLKDPHTYVLVAMFVSAGLSALIPQVPEMYSGLLSGALGILAIFIQQNSKSV